MICGYSDHAANEGTFLSGCAPIALGFVIERFNLFVLTMASSASADVTHRLQLEKLSGPLGRHGGLLANDQSGAVELRRKDAIE